MKTDTTSKKEYIFAIGRRREAVARVRLYSEYKSNLAWDDASIKEGDIFVNGMPINQYFASEVMRHMYSAPLRVTNTQNKYTWTIKVEGGGPAGQLRAVVLGMANALCVVDGEDFRTVLKQKGFLTRDARVRERRKVGTGGKARRKKQSPKR